MAPFKILNKVWENLKYRVSLFLLFMYDFAVQFSYFSPELTEGLEHVQLSFSFYVKVNLF
jgi:hypothetical protein